MEMQWVVAVSWIDGEVEDCDEVRVCAASEEEAVGKALQKWQAIFPRTKSTGAVALTGKNILESI
jgi:uncharacterized protein YllA (UPF0747 family)